MAKQDWSNFEDGLKDFGDNLTNLIQSAIESQDFKKLNETTKRTINDAMGNVNQGINSAAQKLNQKSADYQSKYKKVDKQNPWVESNASVKNEIYASGRSQLYKNPSGMTAGAIVLASLGWCLTVGLGIGLITLLLVGIATGFETAIIITLGILFPLLIGSSFMAGSGMKRLGRVNRFKSYARELQGREYCTIEELANCIGKSQNFVLRDVRDMLNRNMFRQGHLDKQQSCLMITDSAYQQYQVAQQQLEERQMQRLAQPVQQELPEPEKASAKAGQSSEVAKVIEEGNEYIRKLRSSNDAIEDEAMSAKISRMELITQKIFHRVEQQPELVTELHKFMGYYLPMTIKLLGAYEELDDQPVQGENIRSSKREIEATLDTINQAFENLLDSFFQNTAWDISTDISVLQTMLAQEGLTNSDFDTRKGEEV